MKTSPTSKFCILLLASVISLIPAQIHGQGIGIGNSSFIPDSSAVLELQSSSKGILIPRMTSGQRALIPSPATGLMVYQTDSLSGFYYFDGSLWNSFNSADNLGDHVASKNILLGGNYLSSDGDDEGVFVDSIGNVGIGNNMPQRPLDIRSPANSYGFRHTDGNIDLSSYVGNDRAWFGTVSAHPLSFYINDSYQPQMTIDLNSNIGMGIKNAQSILHIVRDHHATTEVRIDNLNSGTNVEHTSLGLYKGNTKMAVFSHNHTSKTLTLGHVQPYGKVSVISGGNEALLIDENGNVGIGTPTPSYPLHVNGSGTCSNLVAYHYNSIGKNGLDSNNQNLSAYFSNQVACQEVQVFSDQRIKKPEGISDSKSDLQILLHLNVTDYRFIDSISFPQTEKKVIAQQVESVFPQAVSRGKGFIPNIYKMANVLYRKTPYGQTIQLSSAHGLQTGDKVRLIALNGDVFEKSVLNITDSLSFVVDINPYTAPEIFVFGIEVPDFRMVDYDALSMLHISATQELNTMIQNQQTEIDQLIGSQKKLTEMYLELKSELDQQKSLLTKEPVN